MMSLAGAMTGLSHFLCNFEPSADDEPDICQRMYVCVKRLSNPLTSVDKSAYRGKINIKIIIKSEINNPSIHSCYATADVPYECIWKTIIPGPCILARRYDELG